MNFVTLGSTLDKASGCFVLFCSINLDRTPLCFHRPTHPTETTLGVLLRENWSESKKNARGRGWGWGVEKRKHRFLLSLPFPLHPPCLLSPQLSRRTHSETLADYRVPSFFFLACCCHEKSDVIRYISKIKI